MRLLVEYRTSQNRELKTVKPALKSTYRVMLCEDLLPLIELAKG